MEKRKYTKRAKDVIADEIEREAMGAPAQSSTVTTLEKEPVVIPHEDIPGAVVEKSVNPEYKIEVIKDYYGNVDIFYLPKKDPRYEYSFLRNDDKNLGIKTGNMLLQGGGWQICDREHCKRIGIEDRFINSHGQYELSNDLVLAFIPKHLFEEKRKDKKRKAESFTDAIEKRIREGSSEGSGIHDTMKGIQTATQLGLK